MKSSGLKKQTCKLSMKTSLSEEAKTLSLLNTKWVNEESLKGKTFYIAESHVYSIPKWKNANRLTPSNSNSRGHDPQLKQSEYLDKISSLQNTGYINNKR